MLVLLSVICTCTVLCSVHAHCTSATVHPARRLKPEESRKSVVGSRKSVVVTSESTRKRRIKRNVAYCGM